jgi:hypothetical protein
MKKSDTQSITVTVSGDLARQLEQLVRISQTPPGQIVDDVLGDYLDHLFGDCPDTDLLATHVIGRPHPSREKAQAIADAYNAFSLGKIGANRATVVKVSSSEQRGLALPWVKSRSAWPIY